VDTDTRRVTIGEEKWRLCYKILSPGKTSLDSDNDNLFIIYLMILLVAQIILHQINELVNNELKRIWKEATLPWHLSAVNEGKNRKPQ
jgi:hypothetical protein